MDLSHITEEMAISNKNVGGYFSNKSLDAQLSVIADEAMQTNVLLEDGLQITNLNEVSGVLSEIKKSIQDKDKGKVDLILRYIVSILKVLEGYSKKDNVIKNTDEIAKSIKDSLSDILNKLIEAAKNPRINFPENKAPVVNVAPTPVNIEAPVVNVPPANITVNPTPVNVEAPVINVRDVDFSLVVDAIKTSLLKLSENSVADPLSVRLSDGDKWIDELKVIGEKVEQSVTYTPRAFFIKDAGGGTITPATEASVLAITRNYATVIRSSGNYIYIGNAAIASATSSAVWRVKRLDTTTLLDIKWSDGNDSFDNIFDNYASLSYS